MNAIEQARNKKQAEYKKEFEKWAKWRGYNTKVYMGDYDDPRTTAAWDAWEHIARTKDQAGKEAIAALQSMQGEAAHERLLARNQPCGCVVCYCENEDQCQGCGAKNCGTHPVGDMPSPLYTHPQIPAAVEGFIDAEEILMHGIAPKDAQELVFKIAEAMLTASGKGE